MPSVPNNNFFYDSTSRYNVVYSGVQKLLTEQDIRKAIYEKMLAGYVYLYTKYLILSMYLNCSRICFKAVLVTILPFQFGNVLSITHNIMATKTTGKP